MWLLASASEASTLELDDEPRVTCDEAPLCTVFLLTRYQTPRGIKLDRGRLHLWVGQLRADVSTQAMAKTLSCILCLDDKSFPVDTTQKGSPNDGHDMSVTVIRLL
jgi:hypothetical protein